MSVQVSALCSRRLGGTRATDRSEVVDLCSPGVHFALDSVKLHFINDIWGWGRVSFQAWVRGSGLASL